MNHPFISQIDHLGIYTGRPRSLFDFFSETLGLPVAFPFTTYPDYTTGSVALGNCFLEITRLGAKPSRERVVDGEPRRAAEQPTRYQILGFLVRGASLEPLLLELARRGVAHSGVVPFYAPEATEENPARLWENVYLGELIGGNLWQQVLFGMTKASTPSPLAARSPTLLRVAVALMLRAFPSGMPVLTAYYRNTAEHARAIDRAALQSGQGGRLGVVCAHHVTALTGEANGWGRLLGPSLSTTGYEWQLGGGPALRVQTSTQPRLKLTLQVESLARAREALASLDLPPIRTEDGLAFSVPQTQGLQVGLVE